MDDIYREDLMELYRNPSNRGKLEDADYEVTAKNPMCGDLINMQIKVTNGKVSAVAFDGDACAVCVAASSLVTDHISNKSVNELVNYSKEDLLQDLGVNLTTSRIKCATLPLEALKSLKEKYEQEN